MDMALHLMEAGGWYQILRHPLVSELRIATRCSEAALLDEPYHADRLFSLVHKVHCHGMLPGAVYRYRVWGLGFRVVEVRVTGKLRQLLEVMRVRGTKMKPKSR